MWKHIKTNASEKGIVIDCINGYDDHCHCLISLNNTQSMDKIMQLIKGESSFWFNQQKLAARKLEWQNEYFAVSVSPSMPTKARNYILGQEEHHRHVTFAEEYETFINKLGFQHFENGSVGTLE